MPTSKVQICNLALANLGKPSIQSLTDTTSAEAIACNQVYDLTLKAMLELAEWNFAMKEYTLVEVDDVTSTEFDYVYAYPADCLSARDIINTVDATHITFEVVSNEDGDTRYIYTDEEDAVLRYISNITDPNMLSNTFIAAFAVKLAVALCPLLVSGTDATKLTQLQNYYQQIALPEALAANAREGYRDIRQSNTIIDARA